ncbi:FAD-binding oxidoreductase [Actinopolymorpha sp. B11F2]|uniref:FAD-binding oxidoreductase n=1 Tax=Actinopolymorpha sp. B11F2 TaxID=3160862 RepID=UPI0032E44640
MSTEPGSAPDVLRGRLPDFFILPGDPDWDDARAAWNLTVSQQPAAIAYPATPGDVMVAVHAARTARWRVATQSTGHAAGAYDSLEGCVLLKTSRMNAVELDAATHSARVGGGTVWLDVTRPASRLGLAPLAGSSPDVGVAGYTLGGGLSWLARKYGLAANSATAIEIVTADGRLRRVDHAQDPDLFWALRGGGGNFGVVTALEFRLYPASRLYAGWLVWPWERASQVLKAWRDWLSGVPEDVTSAARLLQLPPLASIPEPLRGRKLVVVEAAALCDEDAGARLLQDLRALGPELDTFASVPPVALSRLHLDPERPTPLLADQTLLADFPDKALDAMLEVAGPDTDSPLLSVELRALGGALARPHPDAGALATIDGSFVLFAAGITLNPDATAVIDAGLAALLEKLRPWSTGGSFANFAESRPVDLRACFPTDTYDRLVRIKAEVDPDNIFVANHPIVVP